MVFDDAAAQVAIVDQRKLSFLDVESRLARVVETFFERVGLEDKCTCIVNKLYLFAAFRENNDAVFEAREKILSANFG